jgi:hypothetical protein
MNKTAPEILEKHISEYNEKCLNGTGFIIDLTARQKMEIFAAMENYAHQFKQSPSDAQKGEQEQYEKAKEWLEDQNPYEPHTSDWRLFNDGALHFLLNYPLILNDVSHKEEPQGMKWVRASERLPEKDGLYFIKSVVGGKMVAEYSTEYMTFGCASQNSSIQWLSESSDAGQSSNQPKE